MSHKCKDKSSSGPNPYVKSFFLFDFIFQQISAHLHLITLFETNDTHLSYRGSINCPLFIPNSERAPSTFRPGDSFPSRPSLNEQTKHLRGLQTIKPSQATSHNRKDSIITSSEREGQGKRLKNGFSHDKQPIKSGKARNRNSSWEEVS